MLGLFVMGCTVGMLNLSGVHKQKCQEPLFKRQMHRQTDVKQHNRCRLLWQPQECVHNDSNCWEFGSNVTYQQGHKPEGIAANRPCNGEDRRCGLLPIS